MKAKVNNLRKAAKNILLFSETNELLTCLHDFLEDYWGLKRTVIPKNTRGNPSDIIYQIAYKNTMNFVKEHFK